ncbi:hypothetical protein ACLOJK_032388 [Asimina triloba]
MELLQLPKAPTLPFASPKLPSNGMLLPRKHFVVAPQTHEGFLRISQKQFNSSSIFTTAASVEGNSHTASAPVSDASHSTSNGVAKFGSLRTAGAPTTSVGMGDKDVLKALSQIIDPDFGTGIVSCGFVKDLHIDETLGEVSFRLELTIPACPIKDMVKIGEEEMPFEQQANEVVAALPWVSKVNVTMSAQPARPIFAGQLPRGLQTISNIVAVSSCKGGVGKSTVAVNLAYTLAGMGARVGIFDADVYGSSLPTMVSPENGDLEAATFQNPEKRTILPTEYLGVKLVSFGFAGQGRAIMRGPMVSGVINQLLTTTEWYRGREQQMPILAPMGELDYLVIDMPPGTGDIQLTLCQVVPLTAAVIVTTPQKLAFIDVAKGVRMFSKLKRLANAVAGPQLLSCHGLFTHNIP